MKDRICKYIKESKPETRVAAVSLLCTVLALVGFFFEGFTDLDAFMSVQSMYTLPLAIMLFVFYRTRILKLLTIEDLKARKRRIGFDLGVAFFLALSIILGYQLKINNGLTPGAKGYLRTLVSPFFLQFAFAPFTDLWFALADKNFNLGKCDKDGEKQEKPFRKGRILLISVGVIFICWIPVFLAYFPAIMSYDSNRQFGEAWRGIYWEQQPILHTLMIRAFLSIGYAAGSLEFGVALMSIFQMLVSAFSFGYASMLVYRITGKKWLYIATLAFLGLFPVNSVLVLCVTKDILFTAFFIFFLCLAFERIYFPVKGKMWLYDLGMLVSGILFVFLRKNGIYGLALFLIPYFIVTARKEKIRILILFLVILVSGKFGVSALRTAVNGTGTSMIEALSVPIQQMAAVAATHQDELMPDEIEVLEYYIPDSYFNSNYNPTIADGPKGNAGWVSDRWTDDTAGWLKQWFHFLRRFPGTYVNAYLSLTEGYWFPDDTSNSQVLGYGRGTDLGLIYTFNASKNENYLFDGVKSTSLIPPLKYLLEGPANAETYLNLPVLNILFRPAFYCWAMMFIFVTFFYRRKLKALCVWSLEMTYFLTVMMGPVANIRYVFQIIAAVPLLYAFLVFSVNKADDSSDSKETE